MFAACIIGDIPKQWIIDGVPDSIDRRRNPNPAGAQAKIILIEDRQQPPIADQINSLGANLLFVSSPP